MSTIGPKAQCIPAARASRAAIAWDRSTSAGSHEAAMPIGAGKMVRKPWTTSNPKSSGIFRRDCSIAIRCARLTRRGSVVNSTAPTWPAAI